MKIKNLILLCTLFLVSYSHTMVTDNRYFPWYKEPLPHSSESNSIVQGGLFFITANHAIGRSGGSKQGIPELWGRYDQKLLDDAAVLAGQSTSLTGPLVGPSKILWNVNQKLEGQGLYFKNEWSLVKGFYIGGSGGFMRLNVNQKFSIPRETINSLALTSDQQRDADESRRLIHSKIGLKSDQWSGIGLLDTELYIRWGRTKDYILKSRNVDGGLYLGVLLPTGKKREINYSASVPFGGNGSTGIFFGGDTAFELKEDWILGIYAQISKRFSKIQKRRLSILKENHLFGAITGDVNVKQGVTLVVNPYVKCGDIQDDIGGTIGYTFALHTKDTWTDNRVDKTLAIDLTNINNLSDWIAEYITFDVFYNKKNTLNSKNISPTFSMSWSVPVSFLASKRVSKTHKIAFSIAYNF